MSTTVRRVSEPASDTAMGQPSGTIAAPPALAVVESAPPASDVLNVNTLCGSRLGSTERNPTKLRISSAPTRSTSASAISATTSAQRTRVAEAARPCQEEVPTTVMGGVSVQQCGGTYYKLRQHWLPGRGVPIALHAASHVLATVKGSVISDSLQPGEIIGDSF